MANSTVTFYRVNIDKIVDDNIIKTVVGTSIDLNKIKKEAVDLYLKKKTKSITGTLIRINKEDKFGCTLNEKYIYYDGLRFKNKFDLYWDLKEMADLLGGNRFEPVQSIKEM